MVIEMKGNSLRKRDVNNVWGESKRVVFVTKNEKKGVDFLSHCGQGIITVFDVLKFPVFNFCKTISVPPLPTC